MCWSMEASAGIAALGVGATAVAVYKKQPMALVIPLGYFTGMEVLQAFSYTVINQCNLPANQIATILGYIHIAFQPFFINMMSMYFIPDKIRLKIRGWVYGMCALAATVMLLQLYPFTWAGTCQMGGYMCAPNLCTVSGSWHLAWNIPLNGMLNVFTTTLLSNLPTYALAAFIVPILYGSWRITFFHILVGPVLARALTDNQNEVPAIWCLFSLGILLVLFQKHMREFLKVKNWFWWRWVKD